MFYKSSFDISGDAGVERMVAAFDDVEVPRFHIYFGFTFGFRAAGGAGAFSFASDPDPDPEPT